MDIKDIITQAFGCDPNDDHSQLVSLCNISKPVKKKPGEELFVEGDTAWRFYVIVSGKIKTSLSAITKDAAYSATAGDILGWSCFVEPRIYKGTATVAEETTLIEFDTKMMLTMMRKDHKLGYIVMQTISKFLGERFMFSVFKLISA